MKRSYFYALMFVLASSVMIFAQTTPDQLIEGSEGADFKAIGASSSVSILVTFNNTKFWGVSFDQWLQSQSEKGKGTPEDIRADLMFGFFKKFDKNLSKGKKWGMKRVEDVSSATEGLLILVNIDEIVPIPGLGTRTVSSIDIKDFTGKIVYVESGTMEAFQMSATVIPAPKLSFNEAGARVLEKS